MIWSLVLFPSLALAFNWTSLFGGSVAADQYVLQPVNTTNQLRVAIVGAGAAGSSAAFWISKAAERLGKDIAVDVYESSDYIGGSEFSALHGYFPFEPATFRKYCCVPIQQQRLFSSLRIGSVHICRCE
jgi:NAD(P)-binding Rossmann-like domain